MPSPELLSLLCAGTCRFHAPAPGGNPALFRTEYAALLSGLPPIATDFALAKFAGDIDAERKLISVVQVWAVTQANRQGWQIVKGRPTVCNLSALAVLEVVRPNACPKCHGTAFIQLKPCRSCDGLGIKHLSGRQISGAIGVDEANFRRLWRPRYESIVAFVQDVEGHVVRQIHKNFWQGIASPQKVGYFSHNDEIQPSSFS